MGNLSIPSIPTLVFRCVMGKMAFCSLTLLAPLAFFTIIALASAGEKIHFLTDELVIVPLSPSSFNWSSDDMEGSFSYSASIQNLPDLPKWIQITYNPRMKMGFLFGTPPGNSDSIKVDVVATNLETFESATAEFHLSISLKSDIPRRQIKLKIHNLNIEDMMDPVKQSALLDIFQLILWKESSGDLHLIELNSALSVGGRHPARREYGEGIILTLGSNSEFSQSLRDLEREVSPLWPFLPCPRDFKKTSVERNFRSKGFIVDWCSFRLSPENPTLVSSRPAVIKLITENPTIFRSKSVFIEDSGLWTSPSRWELPRRNYTEDILVAVFAPIITLLVLTGLLTTVIGVHPEGKETQEGQLFEGVFEEMAPCLKRHLEPVSDRLQHDVSCKFVRNRDSVTPSIVLLKANATTVKNFESTTRGSSPFIMPSLTPTPTSTLSRSTAIAPNPYGHVTTSDRTCTVGRREPPPYVVGLQ